jgi:hypothetical protein
MMLELFGDKVVLGCVLYRPLFVLLVISCLQ